MTNQKLNQISKTTKTALFVCWIGLSFNIGYHIFTIPEISDVKNIAIYIANQLNIFSNLTGGHPLDPTDFVMKLWENF